MSGDFKTLFAFKLRSRRFWRDVFQLGLIIFGIMVIIAMIALAKAATCYFSDVYVNSADCFRQCQIAPGSCSPAERAAPKKLKKKE